MYVDINGVETPNRIGQDVFFINIYKDRISALGSNKDYAKLKSNCSPIGNGLYCSEYYLLGGRFQSLKMSMFMVNSHVFNEHFIMDYTN